MPIDRSCSTAKTRAVVSTPQVPTRVSCIGAFTFFQSGQRPSPFTRLSYHLSKLPGLTTSPPQLLLLEQVPLVHLDLSSSLGLRFEPLIVLFRPRVSTLTPSSAFFLAMSSVLFYGTCSCGIMSMSRRTSVLHKKIAHAWRRLLKLHRRILSPHDRVASKSNWVVS